VIRHQQYLMRAIASMGALASHHDDYERALAALDGLADDDVIGSPEGFAEPGRWLSKVDCSNLGPPRRFRCERTHGDVSVIVLACRVCA
jgi:hypothetical protein